MVLWIIALVLVLQKNVPAQPDVHAIIQQSVKATARDWQAAPDFSYVERTRQDSGFKTYQVTMISGSPYQRLIAVNDKPLSADQRAQEQRKLEKTIADRRGESPEQRSQRIAKYTKERERDHLLIEQLTEAFEFKLKGEQMLGSRKVYVLRATPRAGYQPPNMQSEVLKGMQGTLWVDQSTFQWVKVEADVIHPVTIEGFLARVEPGTRFELEKMPVADGVWLVKHFAMRSRAKVMFVFSHKTQEEETYWSYRKEASAPAR